MTSPQPRSPLPGLWTVESPTMNNIGSVRFVSVRNPDFEAVSRLASRLAELCGEIGPAARDAQAALPSSARRTLFISRTGLSALCMDTLLSHSEQRRGISIICDIREVSRCVG